MQAEATGEPHLREKVDQVIRPLNTMSTGDRTQLRREGLAGSVSPAFFKFAIDVLEPMDFLPWEGDSRRVDAEDRWSVLLGAFVLLKDLHHQGARLGTALADCGLTELRFERFVRANDAALPKALVGVARQLSNEATPVDLRELAMLVLVEKREHRESVRRQVARSYYRSIERRNEATNA